MATKQGQSELLLHSCWHKRLRWRYFNSWYSPTTQMFVLALHHMQVELDGKPITLLKKGSYFGELALLRDMRRTASVRVVSETCDLFVLTKVSLWRPGRPCLQPFTHSASHAMHGVQILS